MIISQFQTINEAIRKGYVHHKFAGKLCICVSCFRLSSWWYPGGDSLIHVTCETATCSSSVHISLVSLKQITGYWLSLKQYIISKFGTFLCIEFYLVMFSSFNIRFFFGFKYVQTKLEASYVSLKIILSLWYIVSIYYHKNKYTSIECISYLAYPLTHFCIKQSERNKKYK